MAVSKNLPREGGKGTHSANSPLRVKLPLLLGRRRYGRRTYVRTVYLPGRSAVQVACFPECTFAQGTDLPVSICCISFLPHSLPKSPVSLFSTQLDGRMSSEFTKSKQCFKATFSELFSWNFNLWHFGGVKARTDKLFHFPVSLLLSDFYLFSCTLCLRKSGTRRGKSDIAFVSHPLTQSLFLPLHE